MSRVEDRKNNHEADFMHNFLAQVNQLDSNAKKEKRKYKLSQMLLDVSQIVHLYIHVLICVLFVLFSITYLPYYRVSLQDFTWKDFLPHDNLVVHYTHPSPQSAVFQVTEASQLENPLVIVSVVAFLFVFLVSGTFLLLLLYKKGHSHSIRCISCGPYFLYLAVFPLIYLQELTYTFNLAIDWLTVLLFLYNQTVTGFLVLFYSGPRWTKRIFYVLISLMLALFLAKFINQWIEIGLMVVLICWDLYAVLHSNGPLNQLLSTLQNSKESDLPPVVFQMSLNQVGDINPLLLAQEYRSPKLTKEKLSKSLELGLGDFIFYSILVAKSFTYAGPFGAICTVLSLFIGLTITVVLLIQTGQDLPAIPIPVTLGLLAQLATTYLFIPFAFELNSDLIVI